MAPIPESRNNIKPSAPSRTMENGVPEGYRKPTRAQTYHEHMHDETIVPIAGEYEKLNSDLQLAWTECMNPNCYSSSTDYKKVEVLMLHWDSEIDDLNVQQEVDELENVFANLYHYGVTKRTIKKVSNKSAQTQVNAIVAGWVNDHDEMKTLLIVYFAGHGAPDQRRDGGLAINGRQTSPNEAQEWLNKVVWNNTEHNLRDIQSDVLEIFDCCYAGSLGNRAAVPVTAFEYIAACGPDDTTRRPGEDSFTASLIWALKELAKGSARFTTLNLVDKVRTGPKLPVGQQPVLSSRREDHRNERIVLHPLTDAAKAQKLSLHSNGTVSSDTYQDIVTLKFVFDARPEKIDIITLGQGLNHIVHNHRLNVNRIIFSGIRPHANDAVMSAVSRFKARHRASRPLQVQGFKSKAVACAAAFIQGVQEEVEEHVHDQVHEEVQHEFEVHSAQERSKRRSSVE